MAKDYKFSELKPLKKNPFKAKSEELKELQKSITEFEKMMAIRKIIIDEENNVLGGNKRYFALKKLGYKTIPANWVMKVSDLTDEEKKKFKVFDNVGHGEWDLDILKEDWTIPELEEIGLNLEWEEEDYSGKNKEIDTDEFSDKMEMKLEFLKDEYNFVRTELSKIDSNIENALLSLLKYE